MKRLTILIAVVLIAFTGCSGESNNTPSFNVASNNVTIWEAPTGEHYIILAIESTNLSNKPLHFKASDFDIVDEDGNLVDTMKAVNAYPSTVIPDEMGVYYNAKVSDKISDVNMKLSAVPHIEAEKSTLTNNQLKQLGITGATTGGSLYASGTVVNMSSQNEYNNVHIAIIGRTSDNKVVSVMTATIDSIKPREEIKFEAEDCLKQRSLGPDVVTKYQNFAYIDPQASNKQ
jgi:hypothetical protein